MARITGLARSTIYHGLSDVRDNVAAAPGRIRKLGGGRKKKIFEDPNLLSDLKALVEPTTRGDPMRPIFWTCRSLRNLVKELGKKGHKVCPTVVGNLLREMDYSLQANSKTREGSRHIDRDAQVSLHQRSGGRLPRRRSTGHLSRHQAQGIGGKFQEQWPRVEPQGHTRTRQCSRLHRSKAAARGPVWGLRHQCQCRMGQRRHRPRHGIICRQRHQPVVVDDGEEAPRQRQASDDHGRRWWKQRLSCAPVEG